MTRIWHRLLDQHLPPPDREQRFKELLLGKHLVRADRCHYI